MAHAYGSPRRPAWAMHAWSPAVDIHDDLCPELAVVDNAMHARDALTGRQRARTEIHVLGIDLDCGLLVKSFGGDDNLAVSIIDHDRGGADFANLEMLARGSGSYTRPRYCFACSPSTLVTMHAMLCFTTADKMNGRQVLFRKVWV